jgi:ferritin-like metal-binding protein YciE
MLGQVSDGELQGMIQTHIDDTQQQIQNLEQVFSQMGQEPQRQSSQAAQGLVADGQTSLQEPREGPSLTPLLLGRRPKSSTSR